MGLFDAVLGAIFSSSSKSSAEMSDSELQRKLKSGVGKNTGEDIATRASYIREAEHRGIKTNKDK